MNSAKVPIIFENATVRIERYNRFCLHYDLVANAVYHELYKAKSPFSPRYESYLIATLIAFDMGRMMGNGAIQRYDVEVKGFARRFHNKLLQIQPLLTPIINSSLIEIDIEKYSPDIMAAYTNLASGGEDGLHEQGKAFHVGATKILHFLNPELFAIIDSNTTQVLRRICSIPYKNATQPGYCGEFYVQSLLAIRELISEYGVGAFNSLEIGTPTLRIFDKIAFAFNAFNE